MASPDPDQYRPWFRLRLAHGALADAAAVARHLALRPTTATAALLRRFELRLVEEPDGVLMLAKPRWDALLTDWLSACGGGPLRLRLLARSPLIWGATAVPLEARASQWQLLGRWGQSLASAAAAQLAATQQEATQMAPEPIAAAQTVTDQTVANRGALDPASAAAPAVAQSSETGAGVAAASGSALAHPDGSLEFSLVPLAGPTLRLPVAPAAERLTLLDERGEVVLERPLTAAEQAGGQLSQALDGLPEGLLQPCFESGTPPAAVLRLDPEPQALGVACLCLPPPTPEAPLLELTWTLPARASQWHYLLVPGEPTQRLQGLAISGEGCSFRGGDQPETLPDGRTAWRLVGDRPLQMAERSPYRFRLQGQRLDATGQSHPLRLDPLPAAPLGPVWPPATGPSAAAPEGSGPKPGKANGSAPAEPPPEPSAASDPLVGLSEMVVPL
jgi:hypothetical protein